MEFATFVVTTKGQALITKLIQTADTADFTNIGISSHVYAQEDLEALETLADVEQTAEITYKAPISATAFKIRGAVDNSELDTGYTINTIGVYADDPDDGEILYAVGRATVSGWMPAYNGVTVSGAYFEFTITVGNAAQVEVTVDPAGYAAIGDLAAEITTRAAADTALSQDIAKLEESFTYVIDGKQCASSVTAGHYVYLKNSTITGCPDGPYIAAQAIPANTDLTSAYLTAVPTGGVANSLYDKIKPTRLKNGTGSETFTITPKYGKYSLFIYDENNCIERTVAGVTGREQRFDLQNGRYIAVTMNMSTGNTVITANSNAISWGLDGIFEF